MRGFVAVALRESRLLRAHVIVGGILGLAAFAAPLVPLRAGLDAAEARTMAALVFAGLHAFVFCLLRGGSLVNGPLFEGRLGFDFSRPIAGWAVSAGRLAAALGVLGAATLATLGPALAAGTETGFAFGHLIEGSWTLHCGPPPWPEYLSRDEIAVPMVVVVLLVPVLLLAAGHLLGFLARSRSGGWLLDLVGAGGTAAAVLIVIRRLGVIAGEWSGSGLPESTLLLIACFLTSGFGLATLGAAGLAIARGRVLAPRVHVVQSAVVWAVALILVTGLGARVGRALEKPEGILQTWLAPTGAHGFFLTAGDPFLGFGDLGWATDGERLVRLGRLEERRASVPVFTEDGSRAAWLVRPSEDARESGSALRLMVLDFAHLTDGPRALAENVSAGLPWEAGTLAVSPDGTRVAVFRHPAEILELDFETGRHLRTLRIRPVRGLRRLALAYDENGDMLLERSGLRDELHSPHAEGSWVELLRARPEVGGADTEWIELSRVESGARNLESLGGPASDVLASSSLAVGSFLQREIFDREGRVLFRTERRFVVVSPDRLLVVGKLPDGSRSEEPTIRIEMRGTPRALWSRRFDGFGLSLAVDNATGRVLAGVLGAVSPEVRASADGTAVLVLSSRTHVLDLETGRDLAKPFPGLVPLQTPPMTPPRSDLLFDSLGHPWEWSGGDPRPLWPFLTGERSPTDAAGP